MEINDKLLEELFQKEIEKQVKNKIQQSKSTINNAINVIIREEVKSVIIKNVELIENGIKKELSARNYAEIICNDVASKIKENIVYALKNEDNLDWDD